jgi:hypothetical protein
MFVKALLLAAGASLVAAATPASNFAVNNASIAPGSTMSVVSRHSPLSRSQCLTRTPAGPFRWRGDHDLGLCVPQQG